MTTPAPEIAEPGTSKSRFRPDIQGLRALAVIVVILDHVAKWPAGGFIGVDVFFVISGFLITGLLVKEHDKTGHISFLGFYRRRIKRIVPAAVLVIGVTIAASSVILIGGAEDVAEDGLWATFFAANWHFAAVGTDYFQATGPVSPIQHYWSLSVEEQFYFVWPWVMVLIYWASRRASVGAIRSFMTGTMAALVLVSFGWALRESSAHPTDAYFSTFCRAWELGIGALLALVAYRLKSIPPAARTAIAWAGLVGILASLFVIDDASRFPAPWALLPVASAAAVIAAGCGGTPRYFRPMTGRTAGYIGDISYSLYLWHFPVAILAASFYRPQSAAYLFVVVPLVAVLSVASYHLVEDPVRKSQWLEPRERGRRPSGGGVDRHVQLGWLGVAAVVTGVLVALALTPQTPPVSTVALRPQVEIADTTKMLDLAEQNALLKADIAAGLKTQGWPDIDLSADGLKPLQAPDLSSTRCYNGFDTIDKSCTYGSGSTGRVAVLMGDSIALSWAPALREALPDWTLATYGKYGCPYADVLISYPEGPRYEQCLEFHDSAFTSIETIRPDLVIVSQADYVMSQLSDGATGDAASAEMSEGIRDTLENLTASGARILVLQAPPAITPIAECATRFNGPNDCTGSIDAESGEMRAATETAIAGIPGVRYVPTSDWFCNDGACPQIVNGAPTRTDGLHMTETYAQKIGPNVLAAIQEQFPALFQPRA